MSNQEVVAGYRVVFDLPDIALTWRNALPYWLVPPAAYLIYSLIRGLFVDWYPYPFLIPDEVGGHGRVAAYAVGIAAQAALGTWVFVWIGQRVRNAETSSRQPPLPRSRRPIRLARQRRRLVPTISHNPAILLTA